MIKNVIFERLFETEDKIEQLSSMGFGRQRECKSCIAVREELIDILIRCGLYEEYQIYKETPEDFEFEEER